MNERIITSGKRKTAVARALATSGSGKVMINKKPYENLQFIEKLKIEEPLRIAENILGKSKIDVAITVRGGGEKSQVDASRIALARAIIAFTKNKDLEQAYLDYDRALLVADVRRKEQYKPGDSKARRKRQKSFR
ncbi:MAG: 30S ribosomal protein S9 [Nanoarchaeota archaeon]|nr:30S ribosomal protein S9 [Nanoarchaeota archaeon]